MYKIMIVDDEIIFREYLRQKVDWNYYGFEIINEARNGIDALEKLEKAVPDVILVDINMPFMDGLALSEQIKAKYSQIFIVLITGYSEFEYARKAVKIGVEDFILKPFDKEELVLALMKIKGRLQKISYEKATAKDNELLIREMFLNSLISNELTLNDEEIRKQFSRFNIKISSDLFVVATIEIDNMYQIWTDANEIQLWKYAVANIFGDITKIKGNNTIFNGPEGKIISFLEICDETYMKDYMINGYQEVCDLVKKHFGFTVTVGIGNLAKGFSRIRNSYMESLVALQNKLILVSGKVIHYSRLEKRGSNIGFYPSEINEKILLGLRLNDKEEILKSLNEIFEFIIEQQISVDYIFVIFMGLVSLCLSYINESGKNVEEVFGKDFLPYKEVKNKVAFKETCDWIIEMFCKVLEYSKGNKWTKSRRIVETVKEYIECNYNDSELNVEKIAGNVYINSSYLRKVFKKEMDMPVTYYITGLRMQKAKELIKSKNIKFSDISEAVGYSNASYFGKCFKKFFGMTPSEYDNIKK